jgi:hypothetical protein
MTTATLESEAATTNLAEAVFLLDLKLGKLGVTRKVQNDVIFVRHELDEPETDSSVLSVSKKILDCQELTAIRHLYRELREYAERYEIPQNGQFRPGLYLMPYSRLEQIEAYYSDASERLSTLVENLLDLYDLRKSEARERLGVLFDEDEYPEEAEIKAKFFVRYSFVTLSTPEGLRKYKGDIFKREQEKLRRQMEEAAEESRQIIAQQARDLAEKVIERLTPSLDGKPKIFKDSLLTNWDEFFDLFGDKNITGDEDFASIINNLKDRITGKGCHELRKSASERAEIRELFEGVIGQLDEMVIDKPIRRIRLED